MNEIERAKLAPLVSAKASGYERHPYIHTDLMRAPITFLWWASTPSGRQSKYFHAETFYRLSSSCKLGRDSHGHLVTIYVPSQHYRRSDLELRNFLIERGASFAGAPARRLCVARPVPLERVAPASRREGWISPTRARRLRRHSTGVCDDQRQGRSGRRTCHKGVGR